VTGAILQCYGLL